MLRQLLRLIVLLTLAIPMAAAAMDVQPTINVIALPRDGSGIRIAVNNPRNVSLPVTFEIVERKVNPDGTETQTPADDMFTVFPAQANIPSKRSQAVRVQWVGGAIDRSRSFTLYAAEVPVALDGNSGVQRILKIGASIHVVQGTAQPKPVIEASSPVDKGVRVTIRNDGARFIYIDALSLAFAGKEVAGTNLANIAGRTLIPPGAKREFVVPGVSGQPTLKVIGPIL